MLGGVRRLAMVVVAALWVPFAASGWLAPTAEAASDRFREFNQASAVTFDGRLYFFADDGVHGRELWRTGGTAGTTELVVDSQPGGVASHTQFTKIVPTPGGLYLLADVRTQSFSDYGIAKLDESAGKPTLLRISDPGYNGNYRLLGLVGSKLVVVASSSNVLLVVDTATRTLQPLVPGTSTDATSSATLKGVVYFRRTTYPGGLTRTGLWRTDGTAAGTWEVKVVPGTVFGKFVATSTRAYFIAGSSHEASQLWVTDGTSTGTVPITSHLSKAGDAKFPERAVVGDRLYYTVNSERYLSTLWSTTGTAASTKQIPIKATSSSVHDLTAVGPQLAFIDGTSLWLSDATAGGTQRIHPTAASRIATVSPTLRQVFYTGFRDFSYDVVWQSGRYVGSTKSLGSFSGVGQPLWVLGSTLISTVSVSGPGVRDRELRFAKITVQKPVIKATTAPKITGSAVAGKTLTLNRGKWTPSSVKLSYQWFVAGKAVKGQTSTTFKVTKSHKGKKVLVVVTAKAPGAKTVTKSTKTVTVKK